MTNQTLQAQAFQKAINAKLNQFQVAIMERFMAADVDPESEEFKAYLSQVSNKWKTFCHINHLLRPGFILIDTFIEEVTNDYKGRKEGTVGLPADEPEEAPKPLIVTP